MKIIVHSDGGARGNPGEAAIGVVVSQLSNHPITELSKYIGIATNNQAEYQAVIEALKWIRGKETKRQRDKEELEIEFLLDSKLVVEQLNQHFKLKNEGLKPLFWQIRELIMELGGKITFEYIPREKNKEADRLVNEALDKKRVRQKDKEKETNREDNI